ncbi:MAG TPA: OsmC family protein [Mucilaginibacter sp.]|jgi:peroxiredoxin-like protein|nr:OsmC family protein [Mucilaginibacter sp.]
MSIEHLYEVDLNWVNGRLGTLSSDELTDVVNVATPPQFPNGMENIWSPEHLFTAAVNSCLMTTFLAVAEYSKLEFEHFLSKATGKLEMIDGKYVMSEVTLMPELWIANEALTEKAMRVLQKAEAACLISNSIKSKIIFKPEVVVKAYQPSAIA